MESSFQDVDLADINDPIGTPPSLAMRNSVERFGVIQPVLLSRQADESGEIQLRVVDGNRRIAAARAAKQKSVPAIVFDGLPTNAAAEATLVTNGFRSHNYLAEFWAMKQLERDRYSKSDIYSVAGLGRSSIDLRDSLSALNRDLFIALRNGNLSQSDAVLAARLDSQDQEILAERFRRTGKLSRKEILAEFPELKTANTPEPSADLLSDQLESAARTAVSLEISRDIFLAQAAEKWDAALESYSSTTNASTLDTKASDEE